MIILLTGNGKGKTTSAIGTALRTIGQGGGVSIIQFIKSTPSAEINVIRPMCREVIIGGCGFTWQNSEADNRFYANHTWELSKSRLSDESLDLVILDEMTHALVLLDNLQQVYVGLRTSRCKHVIVTGRNPTKELIELADIHSDLRCNRYVRPTEPVVGINL